MNSLYRLPVLLKVPEENLKPFLEHPSTKEMLGGTSKDREQVAALMAQIMVETGDFTPKRESLNYTPNALMKLFPSRIGQTQAKALGRKPGRPANQPEIARILYGNRMGNQADPSWGWQNRGRGYIQTTGYDNYKALGELMEVDLLGNPDLLLNPTIASSAAWLMYFKMGLKEAFLMYGIQGLSRAVNIGNPTSRAVAFHEKERADYYTLLRKVL